jgi:hypothetical protein
MKIEAIGEEESSLILTPVPDDLPVTSVHQDRSEADATKLFDMFAIGLPRSTRYFLLAEIAYGEKLALEDNDTCMSKVWGKVEDYCRNKIDYQRAMAKLREKRNTTTLIPMISPS